MVAYILDASPGMGVERFLRAKHFRRLLMTGSLFFIEKLDGHATAANAIAPTPCLGSIKQFWMQSRQAILFR